MLVERLSGEFAPLGGILPKGFPEASSSSRVSRIWEAMPFCSPSLAGAERISVI